MIIKPCPFTGEIPTVIEWQEQSSYGGVSEEGFFVPDFHDYIRISTNLFSIEGPKDWAYEFWNTRFE